MLRWLQNAAAVALFWCLVVGFGWMVWSASQHFPPNNSEQPTTSDANQKRKNDASSKSPSATAIQGIPGANRQNLRGKGYQKGDWYENFVEHPTEWLLVLFNLGLVIFNGLLWWSTSGLRAVAEQQSKDFVRSIEATERTAAAALKSADTAEKDLLASHRPLVTITNLKLCEPNGNDARYHISFGLRNSGKGFAAVNKIGVTIQTIDSSQQERVRFASADWNGALEASDSSGDHRIASEIIGSNDYYLIINGRMALFVNFEILSQDIFHNQIRQIFSFVYNMRVANFERAPSQWSKEKEKEGE